MSGFKGTNAADASKYCRILCDWTSGARHNLNACPGRLKLLWSQCRYATAPYVWVVARHSDAVTQWSLLSASLNV